MTDLAVVLEHIKCKASKSHLDSDALTRLQLSFPGNNLERRVTPFHQSLQACRDVSRVVYLQDMLSGLHANQTCHEHKEPKQKADMGFRGTCGRGWESCFSAPCGSRVATCLTEEWHQPVCYAQSTSVAISMAEAECGGHWQQDLARYEACDIGNMTITSAAARLQVSGPCCMQAEAQA